MSNRVLITGALGDIGGATVRKFAAHGWQVALNDVVPAEDAKNRLDEWKIPAARYWQANNTDRSAVATMAAEIEASMGLPDVVIVNAGVVRPQPFLEMTDANWQEHLDVNLTGAFIVAQVLARRWVETGKAGHALFTSSWVQDTAQSGIPAYCVSKSGLKMLAKTMALELAQYGIRANIVAPGVVDAGLSAKLFREGISDPAAFTRIIPLGELQTAEQVAGVFWLVAQPESSYITGATLLADGGISLYQFRPPA